MDHTSPDYTEKDQDISQLLAENKKLEQERDQALKSLEIMGKTIERLQNALYETNKRIKNAQGALKNLPWTPPED